MILAIDKLKQQWYNKLTVQPKAELGIFFTNKIIVFVILHYTNRRNTKMFLDEPTEEVAVDAGTPETTEEATEVTTPEVATEETTEEVA